jgi:hypothetical protein
MSIKTQINRIFRNQLRLIDNTLNEQYLTDACDGEIYQELLKTEDGREILNETGFTLLKNTDGVSLGVKTEKSLWPMMYVITQIALKQRFCLENVIIAGKLLFHFIKY